VSVVILGIDPGLANTGWGVVEVDGSRFRCLAYGCIRSVTAHGTARRCKTVRDGLADVIARHRPSEAALENIYFNRNVATAMATGQARGAAICAAVLANLPVAEYTALQVKQAVVGNGHADKEQVQQMVQRLLKLSGTPSPDAADALACAICHAHGGQGMGVLSTAGYRMKNGRLV